jgi:large subunit ribosomal protein L25
MDFAKVSVELRTESGKGSARRARAAGKAPGILYGRKEAPIALTVDPRMLSKSLDKERRRNTVFNLAIGDGGGAQDILAMIKDVQIDPLSREVVHIDFLRVSLEDEVRVSVPLALVGTPAGVKDGGNLHHTMHALPVAAKPNAIPNKLEIDVSALKIGEALHASDLKLPEGVRVLLGPKEALASVVAPKAEKADAAAPGAAAATDAAAPAAAAGGAEKADAKKDAGGGDKKAGGK